MKHNLLLFLLQDGRAASAVAVCSFLCFCRLFTTAEAAVYMFSMKRCPPGIAPSHKRYERTAGLQVCFDTHFDTHFACSHQVH